MTIHLFKIKFIVFYRQLIHGEDILRKIETVPTTYESPTLPIIIENCGEFTSDNKNLLEEFKSSKKNDHIFETEYEYEESINSPEVII